MRIRLIGGIAAVAVALGALAFPSAMPAQAGPTKCTGWTSTLVPPTSIRVYRTATRRTVTVPFRAYVETVMAAEWGPRAPAAALQVGAVAVKQFAWFHTIFWRGGRDAAGRCFDVRDTTVDQLYRPGLRIAASHRAAVAATWRVSLRKGERFFMTGYRPGTGACSANVDGWRLYQRDAVNCVRRYGDLAEGLARHFFSNVSWITPGAGDYTGDGQGDLVVVSVAPDTGDATARVHTSDVAHRRESAASALAGAVLATVPADLLLGRAGGDVDGDGLKDLVQLVRADEGVAVEVMKGSAAGFMPAERWWSAATDPAELGDGGYRLVVTDFTGDGLADAGILHMRPGVISPQPPDPALPPPDPSLPPPDPTLPPPDPSLPPPDPTLPPPDPTLPPPDPPSTALFVAASTGSAFGDVRSTWTVALDLSTSEFRAGDVDGDGRPDLVILSPAQAGEPGGVEATERTVLQVALATPNGVLGPPTTWGTEIAPLESARALMGDVNRDGRDDLVIVRRIGEDAARIVVYRSPRVGTAFSRRWFTDVLPFSFAGTRFSTADSSRDGRADLYALVNLGVDADGNSLGTSVVRLLSDGGRFTLRPWFSDAALRWETAFPI